MAQIQSLEEARQIARILRDRPDLDPATRQNMMTALREFDQAQSQAQAPANTLAPEQSAPSNPWGWTPPRERPTPENLESTERMGRNVGIAARGIATGVGDTADLALSPVTGSLYGLAKTNDTTGAMVEDGYGEFLDVSNMIDSAFGPEFDPQTTGEERLAGFSRVGGGAIGGIGIGTGLLKAGFNRVGSFLSSQPGLQIAGAASGEGLRQIAEANGAGTGMQIVAAIAGSLTPAGAQAALRRTFLGNKTSIAKLGEDLADAKKVDELVEQVSKDAEMLDDMRAAGLIEADDAGNMKLLGVPVGGMAESILLTNPASARTLAKAAASTERRIGVAARRLAQSEKDKAITVDTLEDAADAFDQIVKSNTELWQAMGIPEEQLMNLSKILRSSNLELANGGSIKQSADAAKDFLRMVIGDMRKSGSKRSLEAADQLSTAARKIDAATAGAAIERAINQHVKRFRQKSSQRYNVADRRVRQLAARMGGRDVVFDVSNIIREFDAIVQSSPLARNLNSKQLQGLRDDFMAVVNKRKGPFLPYKEVVTLRKAITAKMNNRTLLDDAPQGDLKRLFKAIQQTTEDNLTRFGSEGKKALRSAQRATEFYRQGRELLDDTLRFATQKVQRQGAAEEDLFEVILSKSHRAPSQVTELVRTLKRQGPRGDAALSELRASVINRLATAPDSSVKGFSLNTFTTRWNSIDSSVKDALFGKKGSETRDALEALGRLAQRQLTSKGNRYRVGDVTAMVSQIGGAGAVGAVGSLLGTGAVTAGSVIIPVLAVAAASRGAASLFTNRAFVNTLANSVGKSSKQGTNLIATFASLAEREPEIAEDLEELTGKLRLLFDIEATGQRGE